jgi:hypothetical protein
VRANALLTLTLALGLALLAAPARALTPARTKEGVQRKAVVVTHDAKLYAAESGDTGQEAPFMQVYFLLDGASGGRTPVAVEPNKSEADGWLAEGSFTEWNTLQMINFEPQSGRELARIFRDAGCAEKFGLTGDRSGCEELGSEPQRTGKVRDDYRLLVPVFEKDKGNYRGGFVRVTAEGREVKPQTDPEAGKGKVTASGRVGYDLILVVDSTASMDQWFRPSTEALDAFVRSVSDQIGTGEQRTPFNVGLLFYRDRKLAPDCDIEYVNRWAVELTADIGAVTRGLAEATDAECGSDEEAEAVLDGLSRAVQDPKWNDGHFKVVLLVGDAPPHPTSHPEKNPLKLDVPTITAMSVERNIRFLTFKIGLDGTEQFKALAFPGPSSAEGRFRAIDPTSGDLKAALLKALQEEWGLLTATNQVAAAGITPQQLEQDPSIAAQKGIEIDDHDVPVIIANLPPGSASSAPPEFVEGWVPQTIKKKLAVGEYVFMGKGEVQTLANVVETIAIAAEEGKREGSDAFIESLRSSLAAMLKVPPEDLFRSGESLQSMLRKAEVLPFETTVLSFTAEEINAWKPAEYERLNKILTEKTQLLREHLQKPTNVRLFGTKHHFYVPRDIFP